MRQSMKAAAILGMQAESAFGQTEAASLMLAEGRQAEPAGSTGGPRQQPWLKPGR